VLERGRHRPRRAEQLERHDAFTDAPQKGIGTEKTIEFFREHYAHLISNTAGPRYFGFVTGGSTPAAVAGDWLVSTYDQNVFGSNDSIAPQIERQTIHFLKQLFGLSDDFFGSFVTGATISNFTSLAIARQWVGEELGVDISAEGSSNISAPIISATPHSSIIKSMSMLGMGRKNVIKIDTLHDREAIDLEKLENYLKQNPHPCIVVANAGTVNTGDFDDLSAIGKLKEKYNFWLHVDAAFGGFAALSSMHNHLMQGIKAADSVTIDAHKWLNVPYDSAMQFTKRKDLQLKVFQNSAVYLGDPSTSPDYLHYTPENSRRWRALPAWFSLMAYGKEGYTEIIERNCALAEKLGAWIKESNAFTLLAEVKLNIVCFTIENAVAEEIKQFLGHVRDDGRVFFTPTVYKGIPAIRAAISNWQTQDDDITITIDALANASHAKKQVLA
jgi:glutamate/tyrosine decarboxylase-like PLP-dependent enzyme